MDLVQLAINIILFIISTVLLIMLINKSEPEVSNTETLKELMMLIDFQCKNFNTTFLSMETKKSISKVPIFIKDDKLNEYVVEVSSKVILYISPKFRKKIANIIQEEKIDAFITETVYQNLLVFSIEKNKQIVKKFS